MNVSSEHINSKRKGIVNSPVFITLWTRPDFLQKLFEVLQKARPKILILASDYGRNAEEKAAIDESRKVFENIDWECDVYKMYWLENQGMYSTFNQTYEFIWSHFDRCIVLEDDDIPSVSFFEFCDEMLERYKDDYRIQSISGMNSVGIYDRCNNDYFFSKAGSIWGIAFWKRTYEQFLDTEYCSDKYVRSMIAHNLEKGDLGFDKTIEELAVSGRINGHVPGEEYFLRLGTYLHNQLKIIPKYNLVTNIGCDSRAAHSNDRLLLPKQIQRLYHIPAYEYQTPYKHPKYVIEDKYYEEVIDDIFARGKPLTQKIRLIEVAFRKLRYKGIGTVIDSIKRIIRNEKVREN